MKAPAILGLAALLLPLPSSLAQTPAQLAWPPLTAQNRPWTRWWWLGSAVDPANLDRELARYQAAGLGGVEVTPLYGAKGWEDRAIPYLSPRWMEMLNHAIATGKSLGMETDMAANTGWCFGGPTVTGSDANAVIVTAAQDVAPGARLTGTFDPVATQALVAFSADGKCTELTDRIDAAGAVDWIAEDGTWNVISLSQKPSRVVVKRAAPGGEGPMLNPFSASAMQRYLGWFAAAFASHPPGLRSTFQDSYEYYSEWAPDFFAQFEKFRGYRLQRELPALLGQGRDDHTARVKSDYRETISDIMATESMPAWVSWSHDHGFLARYQAHGAPGNLLDLYADADIPETEMFHLDKSILASKFASSAAHLSGRNLASAETGTWLAEHFTETLAEMKSLADELFLSGVNHILYHGTAYSPDEVPWPGWCFYASAEMNPRNAIWHDVPALNAYIARCQSILQAGRADNDVLVYWPVYDLWSDPKGLVPSFGAGGKPWFTGQPMGQTASRLWEAGYAFDYVSDRQLQTAQSDHGDLLAGGGRYGAIVVPACRLMPLATLEKLLALAKGGATVIFDGKLPDDVPGAGDLAARRQAFQALLDSARQAAGVNVGDALVTLASAKVRREDLVSQPGLHFVRRAYPGGLHYFISNQGPSAFDGWLSLHAKNGAVAEMDPMTGETGLAQTRPADSGFVQVNLRLEPGASVILRTIDGLTPTTPAPPRLQPAGPPAEISGSWRVKFIEGGPVLPPAVETPKLASWTNFGADEQNFSGTAVYTITFDAPGAHLGQCAIDLGTVCQSARVRLNGKQLGTVFIPPWRVQAEALLPHGNVLEVEVTSTSANRIRDLDVRHVPWKTFYSLNVVSTRYKPFDASQWPVADAGLLGPVTITSEKLADK